MTLGIIQHMWCDLSGRESKVCKAVAIATACITAIVAPSAFPSNGTRGLRACEASDGMKANGLRPACFTQWTDPRDIDLENGEELDNLALIRPGRVRLDTREGFTDWRADRKLTDKQISRLKKLGELLLDKGQRYDTRVLAAFELGDWGHADAIQSLAATVRDRENYYTIRLTCVYALCRIADKRVIVPLIDAVGDVDVGYVADQALRGITHANRGGWNAPDQAEQQRDPVPPLENRREYQAWLLRRQERWRQWWKEHGEKIKLDRKAAFERAGPY